MLRSTPPRSTKVKRRLSVKVPNHTAEPQSIPRSVTPPPLPKSASLPLHATRSPPNKSPDVPRASAALKLTSAVAMAVAQPASIVPVPSDPPIPTVVRSRSSSYLTELDQNPVVADTLKQLAAAQSAVAEITGQLSSFQSSSIASHSSLQSTLETQREKKREDDAVRAELKTKMKTLEDSKRQAEATKRDSEKRLKSITSAKDSAVGKIDRLTNDIQALQEKMNQDESSILKSGIDASAYETEVAASMELKKKEIKAAEDDVAAIALRARELEEKVKDEKARLVKTKEDMEVKRREKKNSATQSSLHPTTVLMNQLQQPQKVAQPPVPPMGVPGNPLVPLRPTEKEPQRPPVLPSLPQTAQSHTIPHTAGSLRAGPLGLLQRRNIPSSAEPEPLSIPPSAPSVVQNTRPRAASASGNNDLAAVVDATTTRGGYTGFRTAILESIEGKGMGFGGNNDDRVIAPLVTVSRNNSVQSHHTKPPSTFSPFSDSDPIALKSTSSLEDSGPLSPFANSLIPTSLFQSLNGSETDGGGSDARLSSGDSDMYFPTMPKSSTGTSLMTSGGSSIIAPGVRRDSWSSHSGMDAPMFARKSPKDTSNGVLSTQSSPDVNLGSPPLMHTSPTSFVTPSNHSYHFAANNASRTDLTMALYPLSAQTSREQAEHHGEDKNANKQAGHRRWFMPSTATTPSAHPPNANGNVNGNANTTGGVKEKKGLNPDAKVFSFKGRSLFLPGSTPAPPPPPPAPTLPPASSLSSRIYGNPHAQNQVAPSTPTSGNFFSSLLAFAPSPAERQALQRALGGGGGNAVNSSGASLHSGGGLNASHEYLPTSPLVSPAPSARSSAVDLHHHSSSSSWDLPTSITTAQPSETSSSGKTSSKRSFSALWSRSKGRSSANESQNGDENGGGGVKTNGFAPFGPPPSIVERASEEYA